MSSTIPAGAFFREDTPEFRGLVAGAKKYAARRRAGGGAGFGRFSMLPASIPTAHELGITQYLDSQRIPYVKHHNLASDFPEYGHRRLEADIYLPSKGIIIEVSPAWHLGPKALAYVNSPTGSASGKKNIARVIRNDRDKARLAKEHGLELVTIDPSADLNKFGHEINSKLIPALRTAGYNPRPWFTEDSSRAVQTRRAMRRLKQ